MDNMQEYYDMTEGPDCLTMVSLSVIKENILYQFKDPGWVHVDHVEDFLSSYECAKELAETDEELEEIEELKDDFLAFMVEVFKSSLNVGFPDLLDTPDAEHLDLLHFTYRFFLLGIRRNFKYFVWSYLKDHRAEIISKFGLKRDITALAFKKEIEEEDLALLSNLSSIVSYILESDVTVDEFLAYCEGKDPKVENMTVAEGYDDNSITGNFVPKYHKMLSDVSIMDLEAEIRSKILRKYRA